MPILEVRSETVVSSSSAVTLPSKALKVDVWTVVAKVPSAVSSLPSAAVMSSEAVLWEMLVVTAD